MEAFTEKYVQGGAREMYAMYPLQVVDEKTGEVRDAKTSTIPDGANEQVYGVLYAAAIADPVIGARIMEMRMTMPSSTKKILDNELKKNPFALRDIFLEEVQKKNRSGLNIGDLHQALAANDRVRAQAFREAVSLLREQSQKGIIELFIDERRVSALHSLASAPRDTPHERARKQAHTEIEGLLLSAAATEGIIYEAVDAPGTKKGGTIHDGRLIGPRTVRTGEFHHASMRSLKRGTADEPAYTVDYLLPVQLENGMHVKLRCAMTLSRSKMEQIKWGTQRGTALLRKMGIVLGREHGIPVQEVPKEMRLAMIEEFQPAQIHTFPFQK
jgi:hypothetical protein